jgi:ribosome-associated protein
MDSKSSGARRNGLLGTAIKFLQQVFEGLLSRDSTDLSDSRRNMTSSDMDDTSDETGETEEQRLSKSARKREAANLQELGVQLSALPDQEIKALGLPDTLFVALRDLRRLPSHGAQVRQRQYIGKLMRSIDPEPILAKLAERKQRHDLEIRHFQQIERWRDRLLSEPAAGVEELQQAYPQIDRGALLKLLDKAQRERAEQRSPVGARELFAYLRQLLT